MKRKDTGYKVATSAPGFRSLAQARKVKPPKAKRAKVQFSTPIMTECDMIEAKGAAGGRTTIKTIDMMEAKEQLDRMLQRRAVEEMERRES